MGWLWTQRNGWYARLGPVPPVQDAHILEDLQPIEDACQGDWTLVASNTDDANNFLIVEISRKLDTKDPQDRAILDDSNDIIPATRIIVAWGESEWGFAVLQVWFRRPSPL